MPFLVIWLGSIVVYFVSFLLTRVLSRYRELSADRAGAYLTGKPSALASALTKISGEMARIPSRDLREAQALNAFLFAPAINALSRIWRRSSRTHPPLEQRLEQLAKIFATDLSQSRPPESGPTATWADHSRRRTSARSDAADAANLDNLFAVPVGRDHA